MKILVTGGTGFLGRAFIQHLRDSWWYPLSRIWTTTHSQSPSDFDEINDSKHIVCNVIPHVDIRSPIDVQLVLQMSQPDIIYHFAACATPGVDKSQQTKLWRTNVDGTRNLLEFAPKGCKFVFMSSNTVYGQGNHQDIYKINPQSLYAASKLAGEALVTAYTNMGLVNGIILRLCGVVGPNMTHGVLKDLIRKFKEPGDSIEVWGKFPGSNKQFMHIHDVCNHIWSLSKLLDDGAIDDISPPGDGLTVSQIAYEIGHALNQHKTLNWNPDRVYPGDVNYCYVHRDSYLPLKYQTPLEAIRQAIKENI